MAKILIVVGAKGGTLKTSTVAALGHYFAASGLNVAMLDGDPQGTLTRRSNYSRHEDPLGAEPVALQADRTPGTPGRLVLLPGGRRLEAASEEEMAAHIRRANSLGTDVVLLDTPPALGPIVRASLRAADLVLVPCSPGMEALEGYGDMLEASTSLSPRTPVRALIVLAHRRSRILRWTIAQYKDAFPGALLADIVIPIEMAAAEAGTVRRPVTGCAPRSRTARAYRTLARAVAAELGLVLRPQEEV